MKWKPPIPDPKQRARIKAATRLRRAFFWYLSARAEAGRVLGHDDALGLVALYRQRFHEIGDEETG